ncbi:hypothetical protein LEAN103870_02475 [Legionella anisa]|nr:hypothetical protein [Legionella anisa]AWN74308.1 hypothetical protein DLD14_10875 [Legionella anisa]KTC72014.1 hypothetical protein Lani_1606 [Legionella anisa]MCW8425657.1 hypothetical protein [Legionella anisa]
MFYYVVQFTKQYGFDLVVGGIKERIARNLQKIKFPITIIEGAKLNYNPAAHNDPLISFFNEEETGKVSSVYVPRNAAEKYFQHIFSEPLLANEYDLEMEKSFIYNALSIYKELMRTT